MTDDVPDPDLVVPRGIIRGIHTWQWDGAALCVTFHGCDHKALIPQPKAADVEARLVNSTPQLWRCLACADVIAPIRKRSAVVPIPCVRRARVTKLVTNDGLVQFEPSVAIGREYFIDLNTQRRMPMIHAGGGGVKVEHVKVIVFSIGVFDAGAWLPVECLEIAW